MKVIFIGFIVIFATTCFAEDRFVSLRTNETNIRGGPSTEYPIKYTYHLKGVPIKVLGEYDEWYKVIDKDNEEGWVSKNLVARKRFLIVVKGTQIVYKKRDVNSRPVFRVEEGVVFDFKKCSNGWCRADIGEKTGWIQAVNVWGI